MTTTLKEKRKQVEAWADTLDSNQLRTAVVLAITRLIETEDVDVHAADGRDPYWTCCGDPIIETVADGEVK